VPRVISDEIYEGLVQCVKEQMYLGLVSKLDRLIEEALPVRMMETTSENWGKPIRYEIDVDKHEQKIEESEQLERRWEVKQ